MIEAQEPGIGAARASPGFGDQLLLPADEGGPQAVYFAGEAAMLEAFVGGGIDPVAPGEVGNLDAARTYGGAFSVAAHEFVGGSRRVRGGGGGCGVVGVSGPSIEWLTDNGCIGFQEWHEDREVFMPRAQMSATGAHQRPATPGSVRMRSVLALDGQGELTCFRGHIESEHERRELRWRERMKPTSLPT